MTFKPHTGPLDRTDTMTADQRNSFLSGAQTIVLPAGTELWRFVSQKEHHRFGAFWMDPQTMNNIMQTMHLNGNFTQEHKKETVRNNLAVLEGWSHLNMRLKIKLTQEIVAHYGMTGYQRLITPEKNTMGFGGGDTIEKVAETRRGGYSQFVIPKFVGIPDNNKWASIEYFQHI